MPLLLRPTVAASVATLTMLLLAGCGGGDDQQAQQGGPQGGPPPTNVRVAAIRMESVGETRRVTGSIRAKQRSDVANIEPGRVVAVEFDEAQQVSQGDVLVRIDDRRLNEEIAAAEADVAAAESSVAEREAELAKAQADLVSRERAAQRAQGAVSELDLRTARTDVAVAESRVTASKKQLDAVQKRLDGFQVRLDDLAVVAPFDGQIMSRSAELGEYLNAGDAVATLVSGGTFEAVLDAPEALDPGNITADGCVVRLDASGAELVVEDVRIVGDIDPRSRRYVVVIDVSAPEGVALAPGMSVSAQLPSGGTQDRLIVPTDAIRRNQNGAFVYLALQDGEGTPPVGIPNAVEIAFKRGDDAILATPPQGPLQPGMLVVTMGAERIFFPGAPLAIQETPADEPTAE
ncbi:MAG: efflux RND transporter periplasmic adaptor subunit [Planctomycetota bacterium]